METTKRYDLERLRLDLRHCAETISALKKVMRRSRYTPTLQEHRDLTMWKELATNLCCLRANHRGKMHLKDHVKNADTVRFIEPQYLLQKKDAA